MGKKVPVAYKTTFVITAMVDETKGDVYASIQIDDIQNKESDLGGVLGMSKENWLLLKSMLNDGALFFRDGEATIKIVEHYNDR
jgi:hypothetical protein